MVKHYFFLAACLALSLSVFAQKGHTGKKEKKPNPNRLVIAGNIRDGHKHPVPGAEVFVYKPDTTITASGYTDSAGNYETNAVMPGTYTLKVVYPSLKETEIAGVPVKRGTTVVNMCMDEPVGDSMVSYSDLVPKPVVKKKGEKGSVSAKGKTGNK